MRRAGHGFTLIELLVALFITAIMFAIGYRALQQALTSRHEVDEQTARLTNLQQALRTIEQDFELLQPRPVRVLIGDGYLPALQSAQQTLTMSSTPASSFGSTSSFGASSSGSMFGSSSGAAFGSSSSFGGSSSSGSGFGTVTAIAGTTAPAVTFTRGGWTNPAGLPRSELQRVSYVIENGALIRQYVVELDATPNDPMVRRLLVDHVKNFSIRYMDAGHQWRPDWPPNALGGGTQGFVLRARPVAVEISLELEDWGILVRHIEVPG